MPRLNCILLMLSVSKVTVAFWGSVCKRSVQTHSIRGTRNFQKANLLKCNGEIEIEQDVQPVKSKKSKFKPTPFLYHEELTIQIDDLTNLGLGVGRSTLPDGSKWVIMVPLALPGEEVKVRVFRNHDSYSEADLVEVLKPSPDRVVPQCKFFEMCGGCQYQHLNVDAQRKWKKTQVQSLLQRIGGLPDALVNEVVGTSDYYNYRTKITPHYNAPRRVDELKVGFQQRGTRIVIDIDKCIIATPQINDKYTEVRRNIEAMVRTKIPKKGATLLFRECEEGVETDFRKMISQKVGDVMFKFKAGEFFQNNAFVLPLMVSHVLSEATGDDCTHLIDTYCGSGLFALSASKQFEFIYGVEVSELAVEAAAANAQMNGITNANFTCGQSEEIFAKVGHLPRDNTVIIVDPPRKGCDESFLNQLFEFRPKKIVYVSCDPATQARDAKEIVANGYTIRDVTPFDLFPQTRHIENVMTFIRN